MKNKKNSNLTSNEIIQKFVPDVKTTVVSNLLDYDLNMSPFYQRKEVWDLSYQERLVQSVFKNIPINAIHLVKEVALDGGQTWIVLDGKQRITSLKKFKEDDAFKVSLSFPSFPDEKYSYKDLVKLANDSRSPKYKIAKSWIEKFRDAEIIVVKWPEMSLFDQSQIFDTINLSKELSKNERFLSKHFYAKIFAKVCQENYFPKASEKSTSKKQKERSDDLIWTLRILYVIFNGADGIDNKGTFSPTPERIYQILGKDGAGFVKFVKDLHDKIDKYIVNNKDNLSNNFESKEEVEKMMESDNFKWLPSIKEYFKLVEDVASKILTTKIPNASGASGWILLYYSAFILNKYTPNGRSIITKNSFQSDLSKFQDLFSKYIDWVKEPGHRDDRTRRMHTKATYQSHHQKLQELFDDLKLDTGKKNPIIDGIAQMGAVAKSKGNCQICNIQLTDKNITFDHKEAASLNSNPGSVGALCVDCNRRKNDHSLQTLEQTKDYMGA